MFFKCLFLLLFLSWAFWGDFGVSGEVFVFVSVFAMSVCVGGLCLCNSSGHMGRALKLFKIGSMLVFKGICSCSARRSGVMDNVFAMRRRRHRSSRASVSGGLGAERLGLCSLWRPGVILSRVGN